ncbi:MAG: ATP-dependent helicase [Propionibacteriaceae bacterium]|nr:ATP-dependent helicase [Propionibacteriaceae bacterium]
MTSSADILAALDPEQREVVCRSGRPLAVTAGPGTGKTRALTARLAHGAASGQIDPQAALAVTFTTRAAQELRDRLAAWGVEGVQARTIHSAAWRQASHFWPRVFGCALPRLCSQPTDLLAPLVDRLGWSSRPGLTRDLAQEIAWTKQSNVLPESYPGLAAGAGRRVVGLTADQVADTIGEYERVKQGQGLIDFDDILLCAAAVLESSEEAARQMARRYRHFVVDEFQDVSPIQSRLIDLWTGSCQDVCVVGDPAQTIHRYAGARSQYLTGYAARRGGLSLRLTRNYRSSPQILALANALMADHGGVRLVGRPQPGPPVEVRPAETAQAEATELVAWLSELATGGLDWSDLAVLYRQHSQAEVLLRALRRAGLPVAAIDPALTRLGYGDDRGAADQAGLTLATLHAAKGRQWRAVALVGLQEGDLPHGRARTAEDLAEERRLFYVGLTRAQDHLRLSWNRGGGAGRPASRFLAELPLG